jgi:GNAT superfamily N-acetyltransferase
LLLAGVAGSRSGLRTRAGGALLVQQKSSAKTMLIRALQPDEIPAAMCLKEAAGWNQTEDDWRNVLRLAPCGCFGLVENDTLAATATAVSYGTDLGWIGMVLTHPDFRGRGFARALMEHALDYLGARGVPCVKLDATDMGYPLYRNLGFEDECPVERWRRPAGPIGPEAACPFVIDVALDRAAFGADRTGLLRLLAPLGSASVPGGFALGRPGALAAYFGPCVASSAGAARRLLHAFVYEHSRQAIFWDLLPANEEAVKLAMEFGFEPARRLMRMVRGRRSALPHDDRLVFAIAGFEFG